MISGISSSLSALQAFTKKMEVSANNTANVNTEGFKKDTVTLSEGSTGGVTATVQKVTTPGPLAPVQTTKGEEMVEQSNVELTEEIPSTMLNQRAFEANVKAIQTQSQMTKSVLNIIA